MKLVYLRIITKTAVLSYLTGSINPAIIMSYTLHGQDIREHGGHCYVSFFRPACNRKTKVQLSKAVT